MRVINTTKNIVIADKAQIADSFLKRLIGLLNRQQFKKGEALVFKNASSIHTFFMRFPIDILFVSRKNIVVGVISHMKPFRVSRIYFSSYVVELPAGVIQESGTQKGDHLLIDYP